MSIMQRPQLIDEELALAIAKIANQAGILPNEYLNNILRSALEQEKKAKDLLTNRKLSYHWVSTKHQAAFVATKLVESGVWFVMEPDEPMQGLTNYRITVLADTYEDDAIFGMITFWKSQG